MKNCFSCIIGAAAALGVVCGTASSSLAQSAPPAAVEQAKSVQRWRGEVEIPGSKLEFSIELVGTGDTATGTMSIPSQGVKDAPLRDCKIDGKNLKFTLGLPQMPEPAWAHFEATIGDDESKAEGLLNQGGAKLALHLTKMAAGESAEKAKPQDPVKPYLYTEREVQYTNAADGTVLGGTLTIPEAAKFGSGPFTTVLLITGSGAQNRDEELMGHRPFLVIADYLTRAGIAVLRVDDRGVGKSTSAKKGAETTLDFATDVRAGVEFLKTQKEVDSARIGLAGHSEGGLIAPIVAADSKDVAFIVLLAGTGVNGHEILVVQMAAMMRAGGAAEAAIAPIQKVQGEALSAAEAGKSVELEAALTELVKLQYGLGGQQPDEQQLSAAVKGAKAGLEQPWMKTFLTLDPRESLRKVKCPVLILNGGLDAQVVASQNIPEITKALLAGGNQDFTVRVFPNLNHLFQTCKTGGIAEYAAIEETFAPVVLDTMTSWIKSATPKT